MLYKALRVIAAVTMSLAWPERLLAAIATVTFPVAVLMPFFTFAPSFGDVLADELWNYYIDPGSLNPKTHSVASGIATLFEDGDTVVAVVLLVFSVLFPAAKLTLLWGVLIRPDVSKRRLVQGLEVIGPWSMADVFVASVLLLAFKSFPGGTTFRVEPGYYLFLSSVVTGFIATLIVGQRLRRAADPPPATQGVP